jgi:hypothetical protein
MGQDSHQRRERAASCPSRVRSAVAAALLATRRLGRAGAAIRPTSPPGPRSPPRRRLDVAHTNTLGATVAMSTRGSATPTPATTVVYTDGACDRRQRGHQLSWQLVELAEIELAMLAGQWLDRRLADRAALQREVEAWQAARNRAGRGVNWRFTTEDARIRLKRLYPTIQD